MSDPPDVVVLPWDVASPEDDFFERIVDYLKNAGHVPVEEGVTDIEMVVSAEEEIVVRRIKTTEKDG